MYDDRKFYYNGYRFADMCRYSDDIVRIFSPSQQCVHIRVFFLIITGVNMGFQIRTHKLEGLECSEHAENLINRKIIFFYIEAVPQFFSQLRKKILFFLDRKKKSAKKVKIFEICEISKFGEKIYNRVSFVIFEISKISFFLGGGDFPRFFLRTFFRFISLFFLKKISIEKKYIFSELRKKLGYSFDVKKYDLSIYEVFSVF